MKLVFWLRRRSRADTAGVGVGVNGTTGVGVTEAVGVNGTVGVGVTGGVGAVGITGAVGAGGITGAVGAGGIVGIAGVVGIGILFATAFTFSESFANPCCICDETDSNITES